MGRIALLLAWTLPLLVALAPSPAKAGEFRNIGFIFSAIKEDRVYNTLAVSALKPFEERPDLRIRQRVVETEEESRRAIRDFAERGVDIILALGDMHAAAIQSEAASFPNVRFTLIDGEAQGPNIRTVLFREQEAGYLVGLAAGYATRTRQVGFIGGVAVLPVRRYACGFIQGVRDAAPGVRVTVRYLSTGPDGFRDRDRARRTALEMVLYGADVLFPAAGVAGLDVLSVAAEYDRFAVGVDSNLNGYQPGFVLTSALKRVDTAVTRAVEEALGDAWSPGTRSLGIVEGGVDWAHDQDNAPLVADMAERIEAARTAIKAGTLTIQRPGPEEGTCL
ncbi:MAG: hypothetical protein RLY86_2135 [Pseudomonadota bacterium]